MPNSPEQTPSSNQINVSEFSYHDDQTTGAKVLTIAGFDGSNKSIVNSSFNKLLKNGEKLPGKNNERRNLAYLRRLGELISKYGN